MTEINIPVNKTLQTFMEVGEETVRELKGEQIEAASDALADLKTATNPLSALRTNKEKGVKDSLAHVDRKDIPENEKEGAIQGVKETKESAEQFQQKNPELKANILLSLKEFIKKTDSPEELLRKVLEYYHDVSLADEALDFLIQTSDGELQEKLQTAKEMLNTSSKREILAGKNIQKEALTASKDGLGTPTNLRDMYRDITGNPRDSNTLFQELSQKHAFTELKKVVDFLLHSLGADMKSKGPSIPPGQLHRLFSETRSLQAILGVYRFFKGRMHLMQGLFAKNNLEVPEQLSFELLAKQFMQLAGDRYPTADKVLQSATKLGIEKWILAKIIVFSQLRDAVREVAINQIYRSLQHRDEFYLAILEALEDLEDEWEEESEEDDDDEENEEKEEK